MGRLGEPLDAAARARAARLKKRAGSRVVWPDLGVRGVMVKAAGRRLAGGAPSSQDCVFAEDVPRVSDDRRGRALCICDMMCSSWTLSMDSLVAGVDLSDMADPGRRRSGVMLWFVLAARPPLALLCSCSDSSSTITIIHTPTFPFDPTSGVQCGHRGRP